MSEYIYLTPSRSSISGVYNPLLSESYKKLEDRIRSSFNNIKDSLDALDDTISLGYEGTRDFDVVNLSVNLKIFVESPHSEEHFRKAVKILDGIFKDSFKVNFYDTTLIGVLEELGEYFNLYTEHKALANKWINFVVKDVLSNMDPQLLEYIIHQANITCNI